MVAYFILSVRQAIAAQEEGQTKKELTKISHGRLEPCAVSAQKIEQLNKMVRTHRAALDFDRLFCSAAT